MCLGMEPIWQLRSRYGRNTGSFQDSEALFHSCCDLYGACWCILAQMDGIYSCQCIKFCLTNSPSSFFIFCCFCYPLCVCLFVCLFPKQRKFELYTEPCLFQARWFPLRVSKMAAHWSLSLRLNCLAKPTPRRVFINIPLRDSLHMQICSFLMSNSKALRVDN